MEFTFALHDVVITAFRINRKDIKAYRTIFHIFERFLSFHLDYFQIRFFQNRSQNMLNGIHRF